jgi:signal transduction histidine kinase
VFTIKNAIFILSITHDGKGFNNEDYQTFLVKSQGLGLKSVANRLQRMNGSIQFSNKDNKAQINVNVPLGDTKTL